MHKTLARLKHRFYWPGHHNDVRDWCRHCGTCAFQKNPAPNARAPLTIITVGYPMQLMAMDILSLLPEYSNGNTHIVVVADYFTKWTQAYAIPNQVATTVAQKLTLLLIFPLLASYIPTRAVTLSQQPYWRFVSSWRW